MTTLLIDCHYICYRALYSTGSLTKDDKGTGIIFGFLRAVKDLAYEFSTNQFIFCWDSPRSFRKDIYPPYKSTRSDRKPTEQLIIDEARKQFVEIRDDVLPRMGFNNILMEDGLESDDLLASLALHKQFGPAVIVTSDEDIYQCISAERQVIWYNPNKPLKMNEKKFVAEYGIEPFQWARVKAIAGCSTDDVEGIRGIGEGYALKYIKGELNSGKRLDSIIEGRSIIRRNYPLVKLPFEGTPRYSCYYQDAFNIAEWMLMFEEYGFNSFIENIAEWMEFIEGRFTLSPRDLVRQKMSRKKKAKGLIE